MSALTSPTWGQGDQRGAGIRRRRVCLRRRLLCPEERKPIPPADKDPTVDDMEAGIADGPSRGPLGLLRPCPELDYAESGETFTRVRAGWQTMGRYHRTRYSKKESS